GLHLHLLRACVGHLVRAQQEYGARQLVGREALAEKGLEPGHVQRRARGRQHAEHDRLPERRVWNAERVRAPHARETARALLDLEGRDVRTARLDQVRETAGPVEVAVRVEMPALLGVEEALRG